MSEKQGKIIIGCDHAGFKLKQLIIEKLEKEKIIVKDIGTYSEESMDYPDVAHPLAEAVANGQYTFGILLCGSGNGMAIAANRHKGVRAALCWNEEITRLARLHNDANVLSLPARFIDFNAAYEMVKTFLNTAFEDGRHLRRVEKLDEC
jgi:ribose 5-phosphate isomerase B